MQSVVLLVLPLGGIPLPEHMFHSRRRKKLKNEKKNGRGEERVQRKENKASSGGIQCK